MKDTLKKTKDTQKIETKHSFYWKEICTKTPRTRKQRKKEKHGKHTEIMKKVGKQRSK